MKGKKVRIFSALEVANICGVVNQTAINWIKNGFLRAFITPGGQYRVYADDLYEFLSSRGMRIPAELSQFGVSAEGVWMRILIIDDDPSFNNMLKKSFGKDLPEHSVRQAFDGYEAGRILAEWIPGIIILDINLPGIDGHKLCRKIKEDPELGNPIILAVSGLEDPREKEQILKEGADAFWAKPFDQREMARAIQEMINKRRGT